MHITPSRGRSPLRARFVQRSVSVLAAFVIGGTSLLALLVPVAPAAASGFGVTLSVDGGTPVPGGNFPNKPTVTIPADKIGQTVDLVFTYTGTVNHNALGILTDGDSGAGVRLGTSCGMNVTDSDGDPVAREVASLYRTVPFETCATIFDSTALQSSQITTYSVTIPAVVAAGTADVVAGYFGEFSLLTTAGFFGSAGFDGSTSWTIEVEASASDQQESSDNETPPAPASASDPTAAAVATAVEQAAAAGVEGTSSAMLVRGGAVVPVTSSLSSGAGPRGGVVLETEGLKVTVASVVGAGTGSGVVVPSGGEMECVLCGTFVPGSVVEAWVNSDPRLTAAVRIPADAEDGDCHLLAIPTGTPLDGGGAIEAGAHTLQLRMYTDSGFEVLSTGITVGGVAPTSIPAGEGSAPLSGPLRAMLVLLLGAVGLGIAAMRRQVVSS